MDWSELSGTDSKATEKELSIQLQIENTASLYTSTELRWTGQANRCLKCVVLLKERPNSSFPLECPWSTLGCSCTITEEQ